MTGWVGRAMRCMAAGLLVSGIFVLGTVHLGWAEEPFRIDFEQGEELSQYEFLDCGALAAAVVPGGADGHGYCLRLHNSTPASSCGVRLKGPVALTKNFTLSFDYRTEIEPGFEGAYLGMIFYVDGEQWFWHSDAFSDTWRHAEVPLGRLAPWQGHTVRPGLVFSGIQLYGRVKDKSPDNGKTKARMKVYLDNLGIDASPRQSILTDHAAR